MSAQAAASCRVFVPGGPRDPAAPPPLNLRERLEQVDDAGKPLVRADVAADVLAFLESAGGHDGTYFVARTSLAKSLGCEVLVDSRPTEVRRVGKTFEVVADRRGGPVETLRQVLRGLVLVWLARANKYADDPPEKRQAVAASVGDLLLLDVFANAPRTPRTFVERVTETSGFLRATSVYGTQTVSWEPVAGKPSKRRLSVELRDGDGEVLHANAATVRWPTAEELEALKGEGDDDDDDDCEPFTKED